MQIVMNVPSHQVLQSVKSGDLLRIGGSLCLCMDVSGDARSIAIIDGRPIESKWFYPGAVADKDISIVKKLEVSF